MIERVKKFGTTLGRQAKSRKIFFGFFVTIAIAVGLFSYYLGMNGVMPQSSIYFLDDVKMAQKGEVVLVFSPHPDDETIGAGGYIAQATENGAIVKIVLVTDGNKHGLKDRRYEEFRDATSNLGVSSENLTFLNYPDGRLNKVPKDQVVSDIQREIEKDKPNYIIYPNPIDKHPDHATVGEYVEGIIANRKDITSYQYLVHYPNYPKPKMFRRDLYLLPPIEAIRFDKEWKRLMLDPQVEDKKINAIFAYKTQLRVPLLRSLILSSVRKNELFSLGD